MSIVGSGPLAHPGTGQPTTAPKVVAAAIKRLGVKAAFAVPGVPISETLEELQGPMCQIPVCVCRNEQTCVIAAAGYGYFCGSQALAPYNAEAESYLIACGMDAASAARISAMMTATTQPLLNMTAALAFSTSGPAFMNALGGIAECHVNSWPMIVLASSTSTVNDQYFLDFQAYPQMAIIEDLVKRGVIKHAARCEKLDDIFPALIKANEIALQDQPGVCYVELPARLLRSTNTAEADQALTKLMDFSSAIPFVARRPAEGIDQMVAALKSSVRPLIIVGKGLAYSGNTPISYLLSKSEAVAWIPILTSAMGKGIILKTDSRDAAAARTFAMKQSDCVFAFGVRLNWMFDHRNGWLQNKNGKVFCMSLSKELPEAIRNSCQNFQGDAALSILEFLKEAVRQKACTEAHKAWLGKIQAQVDASTEKLNALRQDRQHAPVVYLEGCRRFVGGMRFGQVFNAITSRIDTLTCYEEGISDSYTDLWLGPGRGADITFVVEGACSMDQSRLYIDGTHAKCRMDAATFAAMGVGTGFAIGAAVWKLLYWKGFACVGPKQGVSPDQLELMRKYSMINLIQGDSAFGFSGLEFETVFRYKLPVMMCIVDNGGMYAMYGDSKSNDDLTMSNDAIVRMQNIPVQDLTPDFKFSFLAKACGGEGWETVSLQELETVLDRWKLRQTDLPLLIHAKISPSDGASATGIAHVI